MNSIPEIIDGLGGPTALAAAIGTTQQNVTNMKQRQSIPPRFWSAVVAVANERGKAGVTLAVLADLAARRAAREPEGAQAEGAAA